MFSRIAAVSRKEIKQLIRDKRMMFVMLFFPAFLLIVFGYAVNFDVQNIKMAVYDLNKTQQSRDFVNSISSSSYFEIVKNISDRSEIKKILDKKYAQAVLIIPADYSKKLYKKGENPEIQFLIDGVDGNTATIIQNYINGISINYSKKIQGEIFARAGKTYFQPIDLETRFWFNPNLETTKFLLPGLIAVILIVTAVISVSLTLVREKEHGSIEQINVSSIKSFELLLGKTLPYVAIGLIDAVFILIAGFLLFGVEVSGSLILLFFSTLVFLVAATSLGIFISVLSDSQQVAFLVATFVSLLPSILFSGFVFPIESMPFFIQVITNITPAKFYIVCLRAIMLRGVGLYAFWDQIIYLLVFAFIFLRLGTIVSRRKALKA